MRAVSEYLGGQVDILHLDAHPDIYHQFEGNYYSHASSFARIMEGGYARRLLQVLFAFYFTTACLGKVFDYFRRLIFHASFQTQVGIRSINKEGREQGKKFGVEQFEMRTFSQDRVSGTPGNFSTLVKS